MTISNSNVLAKQAINNDEAPPFAAPPRRAGFEPRATWASRLIFFWLCAAIVLTTLAYGAVHPAVIGLFWASAGVLTALWAFDAVRSGALRFNRSLLQIPLVGAAVFGLVQILPFGAAETAGVAGLARTISFDPYATLLAVCQFAALLIYFAAALAFVDRPQRLKTIVFFITIFGFVFAFYAVIQNLLDPGRIYGVYEIAGVQPFGSFVNKHHFAAVVEMCVALPLGLLFTGAAARDKRLLFLTAIGLMGVALVMSGSRGGLVALLAEIVFLAVAATETRTARQLWLKIVLALALVGGIVAGTFLIGGDSTLTRIAETAQSADPTSSRLEIWQATLEITRQNPFFGAGWGAFGVAYTQFDPLAGRIRTEQAHNDYLQVLADAGIVGALLAGFFAVVLLREGWRRTGSKDLFRRGVAVGALAGCVAILVHSLFDFVLHTTAVALLFLIMAALATINGRVEDDNSKRESSRAPRQPPGKASVTPIESKRKRRRAENEDGQNATA